MSLSNNFPTIRPTLLLDFANSNRLDPRVTFTRASTATYYDGVTTAKAEENLLLQSQNFATTWGNTNTTETTDVTAAPDGTTTADSIIETAVTGPHGVFQSFESTTGLQYVFSIFVKKGDGASARNFLQIAFTSSRFGSSSYANFDIVNGTVTVTGAGLTSATITSAGNNWWRCVIVDTCASGGTTNALILNITTGTAVLEESYAGSTSANVFLWGAQLEQRSSVTAYTATTTQAITNYIPVLQTAQSNVPRFDHNPITNASLGLLIEEQRTNIEPNSEALTSVTGSSILNNVTIAPSGLVTADKLVEDTSTGGHQVNTISITWAGNTAYTFTIFLKADTRNQVNLAFGTAGNWVGSQRSAQFDLSNGTVIGTGGANVTASIEAVGNGWYRCRITCTTIATPVPSTVQTQMWVGGTATYTGNGTSGLFFWGAQVEVGSFPTSYIPTSGTTLTRNADVASMTGTNFSSWFNPIEGTIYTESELINGAAVVAAGTTNFTVTWFSDGGSTNFITQRYNASATPPLQFAALVNNATQWAFTSAALPLNAYSKNASAYKLNDIAQSVNAGTTGTDSNATIPVLNRLDIGVGSLQTQALNGHIRKLYYYGYRMPNSQLQALTL